MSAKLHTNAELRLRIYSALVLILLTLCLTYLGARTFAILIIVMSSLMAWEWGRVVRGTGTDAVSVVQVAAIAAAGVMTLYRYPLLAFATIMLATLAAFWLHKLLKFRADAWWSAAGVYYAGFPAIALIAIRADPQYGFIATMYLFIVVWCADSGAYFAGRLIGGPRLAPSISPNKTWAGLIGGAVTASLAGAAFAVWFEETSIVALAFVSLTLAIISQMGDLGESAIKRIFGVKHSSDMIPGHGGVLDRLDGLVFAAVGAGLIAVAVDPLNPGRALLVW
jgi:phosphatidate cytidylyltransferase